MPKKEAPSLALSRAFRLRRRCPGWTLLGEEVNTVLNEQTEKTVMLDGRLEQILVFAVRQALKPEKEGETKRLNFLPDYVSELIPLMSDNTLWVMSNDIDDMCVEAEGEKDNPGWLSLRCEILREQKERNAQQNEDREAEMIVAIDDEHQQPRGDVSEQGDDRDVLGDFSRFRALSKKERQVEFEKGEKTLKKILNEEFLSLAPEPFFAAITATLETYSEKNGYKASDVLNVLWAYPKGEIGL